jgi:hypothetical protein
MMNQIKHFFLKPLSLAASLFSAALIGFGVALWVISPEFIFTISDAANFPRGDQAQALTGAHYFIRDEWRLPLFEVQNIGLDFPINVAFMDSIPLFALFFKIWYGLTGETVNYFGFWIAICFILQAVAFTLLIRRFIIVNRIMVIATTILVCLAPSMLFRYWLWHLALCGHFLIIFALLLYFRLDKTDSWKRLTLCWLFLLIAALWIHPYFLAMCFSFFIVYVGQRIRFEPYFVTIKQMFALSTLVMGGLIGVMLLSGHISTTSIVKPDSGFGNYSMNLLAPFGAMGKSGIIKGTGHFARATDGQIEGFNYLGAGLFLSLGISTVAAFRRPRHLVIPAMKKHWPLFFLFLGFTIFALSNRIFIGPKLFLEYSFPEVLMDIANTFQSSGRFFWPVFYGLLLTSTLFILRSFPERVALCLLVLVTIMQVWDTHILRKVVVSEKPAGEIAADPALQAVFAAHRRVEIYPPSKCIDGKAEEQNYELQLLAAYYGLETNSISGARFHVDCRAQLANLFKTKLDEGKLIVIHPIPGMAISKDWQKYCFELSGLTLITLQKQHFTFLEKKSMNN